MFGILKTLTDSLTLDLAIDLGSTNTLIYRKGSGIIIDEPTAIAFQKVDNCRRTVGVGTRAKELLGLRAGDITVVKPVTCGVIADAGAARKMLGCFIDRIRQHRIPGPVRVIANVPAEATEVDKKAVRTLIKSAGAREVHLIEEPRAVAIGAGMNIADDNAAMVIDVGGGITEMAVLVEGKVIATRSIRVGGEHMDRAIVDHMRVIHNLHIDAALAEMIKIHVGEAFPGGENRSIEIEGVNIGTSRTVLVDVTSHEICRALSQPLEIIKNTIKDFLASLSPALYVDILDRGILLAGGGALLINLDRLFEREISIPVIKAPNPLSCVVQGSGDAFEYLEQIRLLDEKNG